MSSLHSSMKELASGQEEFRATIVSQVNLLAAQVHQALTHLVKDPSPPGTAAPSPPVTAVYWPGPASHASTLRLAPPEPFAGDSGECRPFLVSCDMHYEHSPAAFPTERSKVAFMISYLTGRARAWATAEWARDSSVCGSLEEFKQALRRAFDPLSSDREKARELSSIRQGNDSVCDYAIRFRTLATDSGWNRTALYDIFLKGLSDQIQDLLVPLDLPTDLDSLIALAVRTDNRLQERQRSRHRTVSQAGHRQGGAEIPTPSGRSSSHRVSPAPQRKALPEEGEEPMQLGRAKLSSEERRRRLQEGRCFYCGQQSHLLAACPAKGQAHQKKGGHW